MPEDFFELFYNYFALSHWVNIGWQEQADCYGYLEDRDAFCMYLNVSI